MRKEIVEYRSTVLDLLSKFIQQDGQALNSKILTIVHYTNEMLRDAETDEDLQSCAETIKDIRVFAEKNNIEGLNEFCIGCDMEFYKKFLTYMEKNPNQNVDGTKNYETVQNFAKNMYNSQSYGLEVLKHQISELDSTYKSNVQIEEVKYTDVAVETLINACKKEEDFQSLLEGIQSIEVESPKAKEKIKSIIENVSEKMQGKTPKNVSDNSVVDSDYIKRTLPSIYESLTIPQNGGYDLDEVAQIKRTLRNIDDFLLTNGKDCFSQGELNEVIDTLNKCIIEANGILKFAEAFQDGVDLDWTNWRNRVDQYPALSSALLASERVVRVGEINKQAAIIKDLARDRENQFQRDEGGRK